MPFARFISRCSRDYAIKSETKLMDVEASGDLGYFWSTYALTATPKSGGESFEEEGKSVFIVKRELKRCLEDRPPDRQQRPVPTSS